ncbi:MAG: flagellar biosynthetic protein FliR [Bryobacter sp.]|nr:flagellar biosynthetic protein FliR [Bryobacter sp. CoA8 C33]
MNPSELERAALIFAGELIRAVSAVSILHLPGMKQMPAAARVALGLMIAAACFAARWPGEAAALDMGSFWGLAGRNLITGLFVALLWNLVLEACALAVQLASVQSGLSYASIIDPTNDTESGSLLAIVQFCLLLTLLAGGVHLEFLAALLEADPIWERMRQSGVGLSVMKQVLGFSFETGLRLAAPYVACMILLDLASALAGKFAERFQVSVLIFPLKWLATLLLLWVSTASLHLIEARLAGGALAALREGGGR